MARHPSPHTLRRPEPRLSANELARYMVVSDTARIGIIHRAAESTTPARVRYSDVRRTLRTYLGDTHRPRGVLATARARFEQQSDDSGLSTFNREDSRLSVDVLTAFGRMQNQLGGYDFVPAPQRPAPLVLAGVEVSVNLDLLIHRTQDGMEQIGGALFRFTKADDETDSAAARRRETGLYAATLVMMQVAQNLVGNRTPNHQLCLSIDVQAEDIHVAPRTYARRALNLENACRFIARMWGHA